VSAPKLRKFLTETRAATAVEFAMIGTVLFVFLFALLLMGVSQFWQMTLDDAVRNAARQVALGAESPSSSGDHSGSDFVASVCGEFGASVVNCSTNLQYSVPLPAPTHFRTA
jgi:Flp pilus assembly protein TadG